MLEILLECKSIGTTFLVGGRKIEGDFKVCVSINAFFTHIWERKKIKEVIWYYIWYLSKVLENLDIPEELREMFISIPEEKFRIDISSTEIRKSQGLWCIKWSYSTADLGWFSTTIEGTNESFQIARAMLNPRGIHMYISKTHSTSILHMRRHWMMNTMLILYFFP
jgi:hypothetical protein